jgi:hypothetical protein
MPVVGGRKYPYTKRGIKSAARAKQRTKQKTRTKRAGGMAAGVRRTRRTYG